MELWWNEKPWQAAVIELVKNSTLVGAASPFKVDRSISFVKEVGDCLDVTGER